MFGKEIDLTGSRSKLPYFNVIFYNNVPFIVDEEDCMPERTSPEVIKSYRELTHIIGVNFSLTCRDGVLIVKNGDTGSESVLAS